MNDDDDLAQLISDLISEGLSPREAAKVARLQRENSSGAIQKTSTKTSRYNGETPEQAKKRWEEEERNDPAGLYSLGGLSLGGVFGSGTVASTDYDPEANSRTYDRAEKLASMQIQMETYKLLKELQEDRRSALPPTQNVFGRLLGKKKR